ncbi:MAG: dihydrodipicolinate synthase family protein [Thermoplasmata archaeon]
MKDIKGIITPAITPFKNNDLDVDGLRNLIDHLHKIKVSGIFPMGSTGAMPLFNKEMHKKVLKEFSNFIKENDIFIPGTGKNNIEETIEISKFVEDLGADAIVIVTPYYMKLNQDSIYIYYKSVLEKIELPVLIYNIPQLTGNIIKAETVNSLANEYSHVLGIKDSSGDLSLFQDFLFKIEKKFKVFQGQDEFLLSSLILGASGGVCGTTNFSDLAIKVMKYFSEKNIEKAFEYQKKLSVVKNYLNSKTFPQAYSYLFYKLLMGKDYTGTVSPLNDLSKKEKDEINKNLIPLL